MPAQSHINRVGTALPPNEAHQSFLRWADEQIVDRRERALLRRMASRSGIERRWTVLDPPPGATDQTGAGGFYEPGRIQPTSARMAVYAQTAPELCVAAIEALGPVEGITHLVLASCTGFIAPGIDQIVAQRIGLPPTVERTLVGFMGCYAAVAALRVAHHIVRSQPQARVLVVTVELCTLHLQPVTALEPILAMLLFGDGAAAALVSADPVGLAYDSPFADTVPGTGELITWTVGDQGFAMQLSGAVPAAITGAIADPGFRERLGAVEGVDCWAVHAGGRTVLDAVEHGFALDPDALEPSRAVLRDCGNMSSATLMFVFARILAERRQVDDGLAIAFGPGLAAEGFRFRSAP